MAHSQFECLVEVWVVRGLGSASHKLLLVGGDGGADQV